MSESQRIKELEYSLRQLVEVVGLTAFKHEYQRSVLQEAVDHSLNTLKQTVSVGVRK